MSLMSYELIFIINLFLSSLMALSSSSLFMVWMSMEINLMMFIPLITQAEKLPAESAMKYFLTQTIASILFLLMILMVFANNENIMTLNSSMINMLLQSSLLIKLAAAPFHFWLPHLIEGLPWYNTMLIITWQKIIPLMMILLLKTSILLYLSSILSVICGTLSGMNQLSLRKMLSYSSISNMGWMLIASSFSSSLMVIYYFMYTYMTLIFMFLMKIINTYHISHLSNNMNNKFNFMLSLFSLGGLPPLIGFFPKWLVLHEMILNMYIGCSMIYIFCSILTLLYYLRIIYNFILFNPTMSNWFYTKTNPSLLLTMISIMNLCSLPMLIFSF